MPSMLSPTRVLRMATVVLGAALAYSPISYAADGWVRHSTDIAAGLGLRVTAIHYPAGSPRAIAPSGPTAAAASVLPIPIAGPVPHIAVGLTNAAKSGEFVWAHVLANSLVGSPLNPPLSQNYAIGTFDTGGTVNIIGYCQREALGLTSAWLTGNTVPVGGVGGQIDADVSKPLGVFVAGLQDIDPVTSALDTNAMVGHWHVSVASPQESACGDIIDIPTAIGTPLFAFHSVVIRNDNPQQVEHGGRIYYGPAVEIYDWGDPAVPTFPTVVPLDPRPPGQTTSAYYPDILNMDFQTPWVPTALVTTEGDIPVGGWFVASTWLREGPRPAVNKMFMVDTGAQISLMRSFVAGQLGLDPAQPEFTVEVTGVAGDVHVAPGFYVDLLELDAFGGPISFSQVPMIIEDVPSVEGGTLDGIVGMNVFFNRNIAMKMNRAGTSTLEISDPLPYGDFDRDGDVDLMDFSTFQGCFNGPNQPPTGLGCAGVDADNDGDVDLSDFGSFQACFNGPNRPPACL